ncbi:MAG TPA: translation initiation factor IF-2 [Candidatus Binatia bacterium]|nr:translation initiation factor IF-2 [Candidatus Binatia bacterium]
MKKVRLPASITVKELADRLGTPPAQVITYLMQNGVMAALNQPVDFDTAALAADHFGFEAESEEAAIEAAAAVPGATAGARRRHPILDLTTEDPASLAARPPVVAVLGHVDHGKTSILDRVRATRVAAQEAGGITQRIGAYQVERQGRLITFIDTPGHEAFSAMRARGADVTDVAVLVVAADDGVMPQTDEAIQHIRSAGVPIVVALNKMDKDGINPDRVLQQLAEREVVPESYGGQVPVVRTSAVTGQGIDDLLDTILVVSDVINPPRANPRRPAAGTVIDSELERGRGPVATVLVQNGTLRIGDNVVVGKVYGKVRALTDDAGKRVREAGPSKPVQITGLTDVATAGDVLQVMDTERAARALAEERSAQERARITQPVRRITLSDFAAVEGETKTLNLVLKAEANGSLEAIRGQIVKLEDPNVKIRIVGDGVGAVSESDVNLAAVTGAIVIGFNVRPDERARTAADELGVDIRFYDVVYQATEDIANSIKGMYQPTFVEVYQGRAEVRRVFAVDGRPAIAGCQVVDGRITRSAICRVLRDGREVARARIDALKRFRDDVREVARGYECGITLEGFADFAEGDVIEAHVSEQQNL